MALEQPGLLHLDGYTAHDECTWTMTCPAGSVPTVTFSSFDVEANFDFVHVYLDGDTAGTSTDQLHGTGVIPDPVVGTGPVLALQFDADGSIQRAGFEAEFTCVSMCDSGMYWATPCCATQPVRPTPTRVRSCSASSLS